MSKRSSTSLSGLFDARRWGLLAVFLVALAARIYGLTYHSLWFDEVMSTFWAARPASEIWRVGLALAQDKHPPLYYLALHGWTAVFGGSDVAVRSLGVILGSLAVLPVYGLGKALGGPRAGALAAMLVALNPFLVWYSQEARMFMPATTLGVAGLYGVWQIANGEWRMANGALGYSLITIGGLTAALYTYLFSAFLLPVAGVWVLAGWWLRRKEPGAARRLALGMGALAVAALLFLPLARAAWGVSGGEAQPGGAFAGMLPAVWRMLQVYMVGWPTWSAAALTAAAIGALVVVGVAVTSCHVPGTSCDRRSVPRGRQEPGTSAGGIGLWLLLPLLLGGLLLTRDRTVFGETRYFIFLVPALCLAAGQALAWLWARQRAVGWLATALVFGLTLAALPANWASTNRREAWREAAALVQEQAGPKDAVLIQADYVRLAFERYFGGSQPIFYPFTERITAPERLDGPLNGLADFDTVWLVQSHHQELDPGNLVANWFAGRYPLATEVFPAGIAVRAFVQHYRRPAEPMALPGMLLAADQLRLSICDFSPQRLPARDAVYHPPSSWVHVTTWWRIGDRMPDRDLYPRARLVDAAGQVWGASLERSNDALRIWPTSRWLPGESVRVDYDINLNPITPAGRYRIVIELPGESLTCGEVEVTR